MRGFEFTRLSLIDWNFDHAPVVELVRGNDYWSLKAKHNFISL